MPILEYILICVRVYDTPRYIVRFLCAFISFKNRQDSSSWTAQLESGAGHAFRLSTAN